MGGLDFDLQIMIQVSRRPVADTTSGVDELLMGLQFLIETTWSGTLFPAFV